MNGLHQGLGDAAAKLDVRGTFNARAIQSLAVSSGPAKRTADATEQTARNTKKIERNLKSNQLTFS